MTPRLLIATLLLTLAIGACSSGGGDDMPGETTRPPAAPTDTRTPIAGELLYVSGEKKSAGLQGDLFTVRSDGTARKQLTNDALRNGVHQYNGEMNFDWSPDGSQIAFGSYHDGGDNVWVMNVDGSSRRQLTTRGNSSEPRWSPDGKQIAYVSGNAGSSDIYLINADGSGERMLHEGAHPDWSPDGTRILFEDGGIKVVDADGTDAKTLHASDEQHEHEQYFAPFWSPDGSQIVYSLYQSGANGSLYSQIYVMDADGTHVTHIPLNADDEQYYTAPAWSPNGEFIAYMTTADNLSIWTMTPDGSKASRVGEGLSGTAPAWSPDGSQMAFIGGKISTELAVWVLNADGTNPLRIDAKGPAEPWVAWRPGTDYVGTGASPVRAGTPAPTPTPTPHESLDATNGHFGFACLGDYESGSCTINADGTGFKRIGDVFSPAWSPDQKHIACSIIDDDYGRQIAVINADGTGSAMMTDFPGSIADDPVWSPDGSRIAFSVEEDRASSSDLYVMNADGSYQLRLAALGPHYYTSATIEWSPDGSKLLFVSFVDGDGEVYVANADGSGLTNLTSDPFDDEWATWSPDGTKIAFTSDRADADNPNSDIYVMNADGSNVTLVAQTAAYDAQPVWAPDARSLIFLVEDSHPQIYTVNADGTSLKPLTDDTDYEKDQLTFSPDGVGIAYVGKDEDQDRPYELRIMNRDGSGTTVVYSWPDRMIHLSWLP